MSDQTDERPISTAQLAGAGGSAAPTMAHQSNGSDTAPNPAVTSTNGGDGHPTPLLPTNETNDMRQRWSAIQIGFVDDPRHAVEMADTLVAETMQRLAQVFASQRGQLEGQWSRGQDVSTEDLRVALRQYRSFFDRLLAI